MENKSEPACEKVEKYRVLADGDLSRVNVGGDAEGLLHTLQQARKDLKAVERQVVQLIEWQDRIYRYQSPGMSILSRHEHSLLNGRKRDMATEDKAANKAKELKGKLKEGVGEATEDDALKAEGRKDRTKGNLRQAGQKVKDALKK